ncbi:MAG: hypothetical protein HY898_27200 [Deltaproteobacteria bacterium]|nr:hypothetical protein [Deltaproteobacteria bacterium]
MPRVLSALALALLLTASCSSSDKPPASPGIPDGGSGGTGGTKPDASNDSGGKGGTSGQGGTTQDGDVPDNGLDSEPEADATKDGPTTQCVPDPVAKNGDGYCVTIDGDGYQCNPITSEPCNISAGETCEFDGARFTCVNTVVSGGAPCAVCGVPGSEYCTPGFTCKGLDGLCTRYCCDDYQCAFGTFCIKQLPTSLGICQAKNDQILKDFAGVPYDAGPGDANVDSFVMPEECKVPAGPGNGSCIPTGAQWPCNPVTNAGCNEAAGEACDYVQGTGSFCVVGTHDGEVCDLCTSASCKPGRMCGGLGRCIRYCCSDAECGVNGCVLPSGPGPGLCVEPSDGGN